MNKRVKQIHEIADAQIARNNTKARIIGAIRRGYEITKHHKNYTSRVVDQIRACIEIEFEGQCDSLIVSDGGHSDGNLKIWGVAGLSFETQLSLGWDYKAKYGGEATPWTKGFEAELARFDMEGWNVRMEEWKRIAPELVKLEEKFEALQAEAKALSLWDRFGYPGAIKNVVPNVYNAF